MIREWVGIAWHLKGAPSLDEWMRLSLFERRTISEEVLERIRRHNALFDD